VHAKLSLANISIQLKKPEFELNWKAMLNEWFFIGAKIK